MATETKMDVSLWEKFGDAVNNFSEGMLRFITRLFGTSNERVVRNVGFVRHKDGTSLVVPGSILDRVNALEGQMQNLSEADLKALTPKFKARLAAGETLDDIMPEAYA